MKPYGTSYHARSQQKRYRKRQRIYRHAAKHAERQAEHSRLKGAYMKWTFEQLSEAIWGISWFPQNHAQTLLWFDERLAIIEKAGWTEEEWDEAVIADFRAKMERKEI
jgi:hypothetical protein